MTREQAQEIVRTIWENHAHRARITPMLDAFAEAILTEVEKTRSEERAETARVVDLLAEIRYHVKCDPQMEKSTYTISRTGAQEIGKLLVDFPPRARLGVVIPNPGEME